MGIQNRKIYLMGLQNTKIYVLLDSEYAFLWTEVAWISYNFCFLFFLMDLLTGISFTLEAVTTRGILWWKVFLEISQNSQKNTCASLFFW